MHKLFILLAAVAYMHVARSQDNAVSPPPAATGSETCTATINGAQQTLQPGDRYCLDETTPRVCGFGQFYDQKCPDGFKCFDLDKCPNGPDGTKCEKPSKSFQVQCYQINKAPHMVEAGMKPAADSQRLRRQAPKSCSASINGVQQTLQPGDRYCVDETKSRVCAYGEWYEQECEPGTKCFDLDKCPNGPEGSICDKPPQPFQVQCYKYNKVDHPTPDNHRSRRQANETAPVAAPPTTETCTASVNGAQQTFQPGDRYCSDETSPRVCGYGEWYDQKCPDGFKCYDLDKCPNGPDGTKCDKPSKTFQVQCYQINKAPPQPTGPMPGADGHRRRRQANETAPQPTTETCSAAVNGAQQTFQPGDRYCLDESTPRVCGFGEWYDQKCPDGFKCYDLDKCPNGPDGTKCDKPSKSFQVQCYQINKAPPQPTGPMPGADGHRRRRQAKGKEGKEEKAPAADAPTTGEGCSASIDGSQQTLQNGDRYCVDETKSRVCAYGQWYDQDCDAGFKCFQLDKCPNGPDGTTCQKPSKPWQVQCIKLSKDTAAPSGPSAGKESTLRLLRRRR